MALIFWIFAVSCVAIAIHLGGRDGRVAAAIIVAATIATVPIQIAIDNYTHISVGLLVSDSVLFVALFWLALWSDRAWPVWMAGMQFNAVLASLAASLASDVTERIYAGLESFWALPILGSMATGILIDQGWGKRIAGMGWRKTRLGRSDTPR